LSRIQLGRDWLIHPRGIHSVLLFFVPVEPQGLKPNE
jgi:hypothetical protein